MVYSLIHAAFAFLFLEQVSFANLTAADHARVCCMYARVQIYSGKITKFSVIVKRVFTVSLSFIVIYARETKKS